MPYVICIEVDESGTPITREGAHLAERAYSPDEIASNPRLRIDAEYYLAQQVLPVVSRLVAPVEGTDAGRLAECLGLDPSKYRQGMAAGNGGMSPEDALAAAATGLDEDARYNGCAPLMLRTPGGQEFEFKGVREILRSGLSAESALLPPSSPSEAPPATETAEGPRPLTPAQVANQVQLRMRNMISRYYQGRLRSDDEAIPCDTRNVCLNIHNDVRPGTAPPDPRCHGTMRAVVGEGALYTQLAYYYRLFDVDGALRALGDDKKEARAAAEEKLMPIREVLEEGALAAARFRDRSGYRWIDLGTVFGGLTT